MAEESYELANIINIQDVFGLNSTEIDGVETPINPMIFINTQTEDRALRWLGALNDNRFIGCGFNVLAFTGIMSRYDAEQELLQIDPVNGLPISAVVDKFNNIFHEKGMNIMVGSQSTQITTREQLKERFDYFNSILLPDSYLIVRFGRHIDPHLRPDNLEPNPALLYNPEYIERYPNNIPPMSSGHYVLVAKTRTMELVTIDPHISESHVYTGSVSDNFWNTWHNLNGYVSIDILKCYETHSERSGGGSKNGVYIVPNKVIKQFIKEILEPYKCNNSRKASKKKKGSTRSKVVQGGRKTRKAV
jgi:hypothetical protein